MKAVIYARNAVKARTKVGNSTRAQVAACLMYAQKKGWDVVGVFVDAGFSGANLDRPALKKLRTLLSGASIERVVTTDLSRLSRSIADLLMLESEFAKRGAKLHCATTNARISHAKVARVCRNLDRIRARDEDGPHTTMKEKQ